MRKARGKKGRLGRGTEREASGDVRIYVSPVMLVMATVFVAFGMAYEYACSLTAVILHELAHARVAKKLGYCLNEIRIMPYGAALCGKADIRYSHEIMIAAAGPALNLVLGLIFAAMWWLIPSSYPFTDTFCRCNLYIGLFNLLPVYPLDGGRVTLAILSLRHDRKRAYTAMRVISAMFGLVSVSLFVLSALYALNICFLAVGAFMVASAFIPDERARYYALFSLGCRKTRLDKPFEVRRYAVSCDTPVSELIRALDPDRFTVFDVYGGDMARMFTADECEIMRAAGQMGYSAAAADVVKFKNT